MKKYADKNVKAQIHALKLNGENVNGFNFVNQKFVLYGKLSNLKDKYIEIDRMTMFVENITNPDFDTVKQMLENYLLEINWGNRTLRVKEFINMIESRQQRLNKTEEDDMEVKARRATFQARDGAKTKTLAT
eukprot:9641641-Ditylum_brightwellii.AAC.1